MDEQRKKLQAPIEPLRCGGARGLGSFYGTYWPRRLKEFTASTSLSRKEVREFKKVRGEIGKDFLAIAGVDPALSLPIARLIVNAAIAGTYASREGRTQLQTAFARKQATTATNANKNKPETLALPAAIVAVCRRRKLTPVVSEAFGESIRADVRREVYAVVDSKTKKRLGRKSKWPSASTVATKIKLFPKELRDSLIIS